MCDRQAGRQTDRQAGRQAGRQTERQAGRQRQAGRRTERQAGRQIGRQTGTQAHRQQVDRTTGRQTDKKGRQAPLETKPLPGGVADLALLPRQPPKVPIRQVHAELPALADPLIRASLGQGRPDHVHANGLILSQLSSEERLWPGGLLGGRR